MSLIDVDSMGKFTATGMNPQRYPVPAGAIVINTCSGNDTAEIGNDHNWTWSNPTNRAFRHRYEDVEAVSVECLWQGTKIFAGQACPDPATLQGSWRRGKAKRPIGAYAGPSKPLITDPGTARRAIYIPAFAALISGWLEISAEVADRVARAKRAPQPVFLRDWDTGRGVDRNGPMSHAWVLAVWLNTGRWPA